MLEKSFVFMMLLAASLIGITSLYQPANVETQPQTQIPGSQGLITREQSGKALQAIQTLEDKKLVDRLFPHIIKKIDGATLLQKIDAKTLAAKVLPYLDEKVTITYRAGEKNMQKSDWMDLKAVCLPDEIAVSGAFNGYKDNLVKYRPNKVTSPDQWQFTFYGGGHPAVTSTGVNCLKVELGLVSEPQQQPSPPPGGPPLQPPPNLR